MSRAFATSEGIRFDDLDAAAKERARDWWRGCAGEDAWYEHVQEDALKTWNVLGFEAEANQVWFRLAYSQGDGASFAGQYRAPERIAVEAITEHAPTDEALLNLAGRLDALQTTARLLWNTTWQGNIIRHGHSDHSAVMLADEVCLTEDDDRTSADEVIRAENEIQAVARGLADWFFCRLQEEDEYLNSDEVIDEALGGDADYRFDELGHII